MLAIHDEEPLKFKIWYIIYAAIEIISLLYFAIEIVIRYRMQPKEQKV